MLPIVVSLVTEFAGPNQLPKVSLSIGASGRLKNVDEESDGVGDEQALQNVS